MVEKEFAQALQESEERYRTLFEQAPIGVFLYDRDLRITEFNPRFVSILQTDTERLRRLPMRELRDKNILPALEAVFRGESAHYEGEYRATTSEAKIVISLRTTPLRDASGGVMAGMGVVQDVTGVVRATQALRASEEALRRSEARFRVLIERAPDAISVQRDGVFIYANSALARVLGYDRPEDLVGMSLREIGDPEQAGALEKRTEQLQSGGMLPPFELRALRRNGTTVILETVCIPIDFEGTPAVLSFSRDLTERRVMQARLLQADRMVSVGTLAAGVAHEINNPLAYLKANLDVAVSRRLPELQRRAEAADAGDLRDGLAQLGQMLALAQEGAERVRSIVQDLKTFSRVDDEHRLLLDVSRVMDASINLAQNEIKHRATLVRDYEPVPVVLANEARLGQVFLNLLVNAAQAISNTASDTNEIRVRIAPDGEEKVVVSVSDTGAGIPPHLVTRIFDPFFTTKPVGVGTGLGLWICQGIVTALGGQIDVSTAPGQGTTFRVALPAAPAGARSSAPPPVDPSQPPTPRARVLVIDDEPAITQAITIALADHDVVAANDPHEALELLRTARFEIVLCDLMMPHMTGMDLYADVARRDPELASRFLFVTGGTFTGPAREFAEKHLSDCIEKPFELPYIRAVVRDRVLRLREKD